MRRKKKPNQNKTGEYVNMEMMQENFKTPPRYFLFYFVYKWAEYE